MDRAGSQRWCRTCLRDDVFTGWKSQRSGRGVETCSHGCSTSAIHRHGTGLDSPGNRGGSVSIRPYCPAIQHESSQRTGFA